jgi:hypothetical protein
MPSVPPDQQPNAPPPRGPHDHPTRPHIQTQQQPAAQRDNPPAETANPHQRQADRASGDDDSEAERLKAERLEAKRVARRNRLIQSGFPIFVRYEDLVAAGFVGSWTQLLRMVAAEGFPAGTMLSANVRAWRLDEIEQWLAARPSARKIMPPGAECGPSTQQAAGAGCAAPTNWFPGRKLSPERRG